MIKWRIKTKFENKTEEQAKKEILDMVAAYCDTYHNQKKPFEPYAINLVNLNVVVKKYA